MNTNEIDKLVKASIQTKIIEAFKEAPQFIDDLVAACLSQEVDEYGGKPSSYNSHKMPYLTYLARDSVQKIAREAIVEYFDTMKPVIKNQVKAKIKSEEIGDAFADALIGQIKNGWDINVNFSTNKDNA